MFGDQFMNDIFGLILEMIQKEDNQDNMREA